MRVAIVAVCVLLSACVHVTPDHKTALQSLQPVTTPLAELLLKVTAFDAVTFSGK